MKVNLALEMRNWFAANPLGTVSEAMLQFPTARSGNVYLARKAIRDPSPRRRRYKKKVAPVEVLPGMQALRSVINEQTTEEQRLRSQIADLKKLMDDSVSTIDVLRESLKKAVEEVKGYKVIVSYFEWQTGLRDSQAPHRGPSV
jgi:hypothetical protein